jgi:hypothetical protein
LLESNRAWRSDRALSAPGTGTDFSSSLSSEMSGGGRSNVAASHRRSANAAGVIVPYDVSEGPVSV